MPDRCKQCGEQLPIKLGVGRKASYCRPCKRVVDTERQKLQRERDREERSKEIRIAIAKPCWQCGKQLTATQDKYCSPKCTGDANRLPDPSCQNCGKAFRPKMSDRRSFCCRGCFYEHLAKSVQPKKKSIRCCKFCGEQCPANHKYCSKQCATEAAKHKAFEANASKKELIERTCKKCGVKFTPEYGNGHRVFCSKECLKKYNRQHRNRQPGLFNARARHILRRVYGAVLPDWYQPIDRNSVLQRDGFKCMICGITIRKTKNWAVDQATVDHIIPLSRGGRHHYDNVQSACMMCNSRKRDLIDEDIP